MNEDTYFARQVSAAVSIGITPKALEDAIKEGRDGVKRLSDRTGTQVTFLKRIAYRWGLIEESPIKRNRPVGKLNRETLSLGGTV
jgi:16S rRNA U516 pseudouridylate synthase RsuA-like enzyme